MTGPSRPPTDRPPSPETGRPCPCCGDERASNVRQLAQAIITGFGVLVMALMMLGTGVNLGVLIANTW